MARQAGYEYRYVQEPPRRDPPTQVQYFYTVPANSPPAPAPVPAPAPAPPPQPTTSQRKVTVVYYDPDNPPFSLPQQQQPPSRPDPQQTIIVPGPPANTFRACPCQTEHSQYMDKPAFGGEFKPGELFRVVSVDKTKVHSAPPPFDYGDRRVATHRVVHDPHADYYGY